MEGRESPEMVREMIIESNVMKALEGFRSMNESIGGNAGFTKEEQPRLRGAYNFYYIRNNGQILVFANVQDLPHQFKQHVEGSEKIGKASFFLAFDVPRRGGTDPFLGTRPQEIVGVWYENEPTSEEAVSVIIRTIGEVNKKLIQEHEIIMRHTRETGAEKK